MATEHIMELLKNVDLEKARAQALAEIRSGKKTRRASGVKVLRAVDGLQRAGVSPMDLVIRKVPVIPPAFRPYSSTGSTFIPGDANELYSDLMKGVGVYKENAKELGPDGAREAGSYLRSAIRAAYGYEDSPNPKIKTRGVSGFLNQILGTNPKNSFVQSKLIAKPQDFVGRGVISPDPDLGMDQILIPESMAWDIFEPQIQRALVAGGTPASVARRMIKDQDPKAKQLMMSTMKTHPVLASRAPAWHKHSVLSAYAGLSAGDNIRINPFITAGLGADYDGDTMAIHSPSLPEAQKDAREKLLPSKMLFSVRSRDQTLAVPKHEQILGLANAQLRPSGMVHNFPDEATALAAIKSGAVQMHDEVEIGPVAPAVVPPIQQPPTIP